MSRSVLVIGGVVLLAAAVGLVLMLGSGSDSSSSTQTAGPPTGDTTTTTGTGPRPTLSSDPGGTPGTPGTGRPGEGEQPGVPPPLATGSNAPVVTPRGQPRGTTPGDPAGGSGSGAGPGSSYVVGDIRVRDHRAGGGPPMDIPPSIHTPEGPRIDSSLTDAIGQQVRLTMFECAKSTSRDGRGERPRVDGQIVINVKANQLAVASAIMQPRDLSEAATTSIKQCMEAKIVGMTAPAPNQADLDSYSINMSLSIP